MWSSNQRNGIFQLLRDIRDACSTVDIFIHHRGVLSAQTYKVGWMGLGWKSLNASLVRAPLCGAKSTVERS